MISRLAWLHALPTTQSPTWWTSQPGIKQVISDPFFPAPQDCWSICSRSSIFFLISRNKPFACLFQESSFFWSTKCLSTAPLLLLKQNANHQLAK
jgi:hypothetical protein